MEPVVERCIVRMTDNFAANLAEIESFWQQNESPNRFDHLLDELETVVGNLERFPDAGRSFDAWRPNAVESMTRLERLQQRLQSLHPGAQVRQYIIEDYLLLYARIAETIHLLTIRHHRQLSFDLGRFWLNP